MNNDTPEQNTKSLLLSHLECEASKPVKEFNAAAAKAIVGTLLGADFALVEDELANDAQIMAAKIEALGISPEILNAPDDFGSSYGSQLRIARLESRPISSPLLRDYQEKILRDLSSAYKSARTHLGYKKVRSASARKRKAQRQSMVKYSQTRMLIADWSRAYSGSATGRINISMPQEQHIPKPRTRMTDIVEKMKGFFK